MVDSELNIKYEIKLTEEYLSKGVNRLFDLMYEGELIDTYNPIQNLVAIGIDNYPSFLSSVSIEKDYSQMEYSWVLFGETRDANDDSHIIVPDTMVGFTIFEDITLIDKFLFFRLCLQFAKKSLIAVEKFHLKENLIIDDLWVEKIKELIPKIEEKIKMYNV